MPVLANKGGLHIEEPNVVGKHNIKRGYNNRGKTLVVFCKQNNLVLQTLSSNIAQNIRGYLLANELKIASISYAYVKRL